LIADAIIENQNFQALIRSYNNAVSFTSLGTKIDFSVQGQFGLSVFRISGGMSHKISSLVPKGKHKAGFSQIFFVGKGGTEEAEFRLKKAQGIGKGGFGSFKLSAEIIQELVDLLDEFNPYAKKYRTASDILSKSSSATLAINGISERGLSNKRYNEPTVEEVAVVIQGAGHIVQPRQIILKQKSGKLKVISDLHSGCFPLWYPLFFPFGSQQWDGLFQAWTSRCA
jgi:hypothetical protein